MRSYAPLWDLRQAAARELRAEGRRRAARARGGARCEPRVLPVAGWGLWLAALAAAAVALGADPGELALAGGLAAAVRRRRHARAAVAAGAAPRRGEPARGAAGRVLGHRRARRPACVLAVWGAEVGAWLLGVGLGVLALGAAGLVREERARRRALAGLPPAGDDEPPLRAPAAGPGDPRAVGP